MAKILTPEEQRRAQILREKIARKIQAYIILRDNADTRRYAQYMDIVEKMIMTEEYSADSIADAVANESLYLQRFAAVGRAYNEVNALIQGYQETFPEEPLTESSVKGLLQEMRSTNTLGLDAIINILEYRTEELLEEIKKQKPSSNPFNPNTP